MSVSSERQVQPDTGRRPKRTLGARKWGVVFLVLVLTGSGIAYLVMSNIGPVLQGGTPRPDRVGGVGIQKERQKLDEDAAHVEDDISEGNGLLNAGLEAEEQELSQPIEIARAAVRQVDVVSKEAKHEEGVVSVQTRDHASATDDRICADFAELRQIIGKMLADADGIEADAGWVESDVDAIRYSKNQLQSDFATLKAQESYPPSHPPSWAPTPSAVSAALVTAKTSISTAISVTNRYVDQANADLMAAYGHALETFNSANCGRLPTRPPLQPRIS